MGRYIQQRLLVSIPVLLLITVIAFLLLQAAPGDPLNSYVPPDAPLPEEQREALREQLGLDQPLPIRYFYWLWEALQGNLGVSAKNMEPVADAIGRRVLPTLTLMGTALVIGISVGIVLGLVGAVKKYSFIDNLMTVFAFLGISFPVYLLGLLGLYIFALQLGWLPSGGMSTPGRGDGFIESIRHLILPSLIISIQYIASTMRYTRTAMLDVLDQDYVRTARAKGLKDRVILLRHALKNALIPITTIIGSYIPSLLGGAVFIEAIYAWPGMGSLFVDGVESRDYALIMGLILILAIIILVVNLLVDIAYAVVDPRVRYD